MFMQKKKAIDINKFKKRTLEPLQMWLAEVFNALCNQFSFLYFLQTYPLYHKKKNEIEKCH